MTVSANFQLPYATGASPTELLTKHALPAAPAGGGALTSLLGSASKLNPYLAVGGGVLSTVGGIIDAINAKKQADQLYKMKMRELELAERSQESQEKVAERTQDLQGLDMLSGLRDTAWEKYKDEKFRSDLARLNVA